MLDFGPIPPDVEKLGVRRIHAHFSHILIICFFLLLLIFLVALPEGSTSKNAQFWCLPQKLQHCKKSWVDLTYVMLEFQCYDLHTNEPLLDLVLQLCNPIHN